MLFLETFSEQLDDDLKANSGLDTSLHSSIIDYVKSSQTRISKNIDLDKSYKKLSSMIKIIEK